MRVGIIVVAAIALTACAETSTQKSSDKLTSAASADCVASGGSVEKVGIAQAEACIHVFPDRGKQCKDNRDCQGECRYIDDTRPLPPDIEHDRSLRDTPVGAEVVGRCQWSDDEFGCRATVEGGKLNLWECVD